jgi:quinol-cytochrome oxidoreductase complex cytochrome b subunit
LHYLLPFLIVGLILLHLLLLHTEGSTNPLGTCSKVDKATFYPFFSIKDLVGFFTLVYLVSFCVHTSPNFLGHFDNYIKADSLVTPTHIVPEWYFLPFYAILRSIPNKLGGVILMLGSILVLLCLPFLYSTSCRNPQVKP